MDDAGLTPEQVKAGRALLAWSQQELAAAARVSPSTIADFERGVRTPMANNAQSIREVFESKGLEFIAGGVVAKAMLPSLLPSAHPGALLRWVNATHLSQWGERRDGQSGMAELLRRLIYASVGPSAAVHFPSDESVQYPGWDGTCTISAGSELVPNGASCWEIGTQRTRIREKANADFLKRSHEPLGFDRRETTFVFVTPRRFTGKSEWIAEKKALGIWRDVAAIDGDDLVHWLEAHPAVAQWLAVKIGRRPEGLRNMEEVWAEWVRATRTPLTPDVVLTSRDEEQAAVLKWLRTAPQLLSISAEAPDEAMAFLYAAISPLPEPYRVAYWSRCLVADTTETARQLVGLGTPLIVILPDADPGLARRLVDDGHHVFAACGPEVNDFLGARRLPRPWKFELQMTLIAAGLDEEDAHRLAHTSGRSITVLRRLMPAAPNNRPQWAKQASSELMAAMFAGAWIETSGEDRKVLGTLAGCPYEQVEAVLAPLAANLGGPIVRSGAVWKVVSLRDLWAQIGGQLTSSQLQRFETAFHAVMSTSNPRFTKQPRNKYYEEKGEFGEEASQALRQGLSEAMIALAVYPTRAELITNLPGHVDHAIRKLLDNADSALWWSLSPNFRNIAEAAPGVFLDVVQAELEETDPALRSLFRSDDGFLHPKEYLSELLWSLEMLARSSEYLMRVALALTRLDKIDPGGRLGNRPFASLRKIFVSWSPQTYASQTERLKVIDRIVREDAAVGWRLLLALAPRSYDHSEPSCMPNWRDFSPDQPEVLTSPLLAVMATEIGRRLLEQVNDSSERWHSLLDLWGSFDRRWRTAAVKQLQSFATRLSDVSTIEAMRDKLRKFLENHRGFKHTDWALPEKDLKPLDKVFELLWPRGVEDRVRWLFRPGATQYRPDVDWNEQHAELAKRHVQAAEDLLRELDLDQLLTFATTITMHRDLGAAIVNTSAKEEVKQELMRRGLLAEDGAETEVGLGILYGLMLQAGDGGDAFVRQVWRRAIEGGWGDRAEARIVNCLPRAASTWDDVEARSASLTEEYWRKLAEHRIPGDADPEFVVDRLLAVGRSHDAVAWLGFNIRREPSSAILARALHAAVGSELPLTANGASMFSHWVGTILDRLDADPEVSKSEIVRLEWSYFQLLRYVQRPSRILHRALAHDPNFFVLLIKLLYPPAEDSGVEEDTHDNWKSARDMASQAFEVLHDWSHVPGADEQGVIDPNALEDWVKRARKLLAEAGRGEVGDTRIGGILSAAKRELEQPWPPEPVRDIIETVRKRPLEQGFEFGVYNRRGVTVRRPHDGGQQERLLAENYLRDAEALRFDWPRTAACLERIAATYQVAADQEDISAQQRDWL